MSRHFGLLQFALLACFLSILCSPLPADEAELLGAYQRLRDGMYNDQPLAAVQLLFRLALQQVDIAELPHGSDLLWRSRIEYLIARAYHRWGQTNMAIQHYERGLDFADQVIASGFQAEGWHMKSEHLSHLCLLKDFPFLVANGNKVREYARRALSLDPANVSYQIFLAEDKIYSPRIFGGNAAAGIDLMQRALQMGASEKDDLFNIYSGIGVAYYKLQDYEAARMWLRKALQIYPNNSFASEQYQQAILELPLLSDAGPAQFI